MQKQPYWRQCIKEEKIYLAVPGSSSYAKRSSIALHEVREEGFVMLSTHRLFGVVCNKFCASVGFMPRVVFESDSPAAVQKIVSAGIGLAFWPEYSWGDIKNQGITLLPISYPICQRELIFALYKRPIRSIYAEDFYEYLLRQCSLN